MQAQLGGKHSLYRARTQVPSFLEGKEAFTRPVAPGRATSDLPSPFTSRCFSGKIVSLGRGTLPSPLYLTLCLAWSERVMTHTNSADGTERRGYRRLLCCSLPAQHPSFSSAWVCEQLVALLEGDRRRRHERLFYPEACFPRLCLHQCSIFEKRQRVCGAACRPAVSFFSCGSPAPTCLPDL